MKKKIFLYFFFLSYSVVYGQFSVMTYNIRGYIPCDEFKIPSEHFYYRQSLIVDIIKDARADIIGLQEIFNIPKKIEVECNSHKYIRGYKFDYLIQRDIKELKNNSLIISPPKHLIRDFIREKLRKLDYSYFYKRGGSPKIIFYKQNDFSFIKGGQFYHNQKDKKITTYVFLKYKNQPILFINTHLISGVKYKSVRKKSIDTILRKIQEINKDNYPIVLMGDFNIDFYSMEYIDLVVKLFKIGLQDASIINKATYNGFGTKKSKIDYIFSKDLTIDKIEVIDKTYKVKDRKLNFSRFPSDHWPIKVTFDFKDIK